MNAEFTGYITALAEQQAEVSKKLLKLSNQVGDDLLLKRLNNAYYMSDDLSNWLLIIARQSRTLLSREEERQKDLILKQYPASIDAREVTKWAKELAALPGWDKVRTPKSRKALNALRPLVDKINARYK